MYHFFKRIFMYILNTVKNSKMTVKDSKETQAGNVILLKIFLA